MAETTKIEWTTHSASPWHGCQHATLPDGTQHPGCEHCYAERQSKRNQAVLGEWGPDGTRVKSKSFVKNMRAWQKQAANDGRIVTVFPSICDPFEDRPELVEWRNEMFAVADECPNVVLLLLTKRPENVARMWPARSDYTYVPEAGSLNEWPMHHRSNVMIGTSVSDQATADVMLPELLKLRGLCGGLFVSAEPLLGPVNFRKITAYSHGSSSIQVNTLTGEELHFTHDGGCGVITRPNHIDWLIVGGESGPNARACNIEWIRSLIEQCKSSGVPCLVKQLGAKPFCKIGINHRHPEWTNWTELRDKKGGDPDEWPADLRVRQFPACLNRDSEATQ